MSKHYYDFKTDGKDPVSKLLVTLKLALVGTSLTAVYNFKPEYENIRKPLNMIAKHALTWTSVTTTFTATVLLLTNIRKKDDPWNYFLAANASCAVFYSMTRQGQVAFGLAILSSIGAAIFKSAVMQGYDPYDLSGAHNNAYRTSFVLENTPDVRYLKKN